MSYVCKDKEEETGGFGFVLSNSLNFLRSSDSNRAVSHPSRDSTPESPSHSELWKPVWAAFSLASNFGSPHPASIFATPSWLTF